MTNVFQSTNVCGSKRKCLCGDSIDQVRTSEVMASLLSKMELETMMASLQMTSATTRMTNQYLQKIGKTVGAHAIL